MRWRVASVAIEQVAERDRLRRVNCRLDDPRVLAAGEHEGDWVGAGGHREFASLQILDCLLDQGAETFRFTGSFDQDHPVELTTAEAEEDPGLARFGIKLMGRHCRGLRRRVVGPHRPIVQPCEAPGVSGSFQTKTGPEGPVFASSAEDRT